MNDLFFEAYSLHPMFEKWILFVAMGTYQHVLVFKLFITILFFLLALPIGKSLHIGVGFA